MNHKQQIIQDAIEGGWKDYMSPKYDTPITKETDGVWFNPQSPTIRWVPVSECLLDPSFWQAVDKTRGWNVDEGDWRRTGFTTLKNWREHWHQFIYHLAEGDDYETALSKLV